MSSRLPKLIAFDLDKTFWDFDIGSERKLPFRRRGNEVNKLRDRNDEKISLFPDVPKILLSLGNTDTTLAVCSRTGASKAAREALSQLLMPMNTGRPEPVINMFSEIEIYPGSKINHFKKLHKSTGIAYSEMLFFDDWKQNMDVESLGVTFILVPDGLDHQIFQSGMKEWRNKHSNSSSSSRGYRSNRRNDSSSEESDSSSDSEPQFSRRKGKGSSRGKKRNDTDSEYDLGPSGDPDDSNSDF